MKQPKKETSVISPRKPLDDRPDYSSTTSESEEDFSPSVDAKLFLSHDITAGGSNQTPNTNSISSQTRILQKLVLEKASYAKPTVTEDYTRCIYCLRHHRHCGRMLPKCSTCATESDCVYLKKGIYPTVTKIVRA